MRRLLPALALALLASIAPAARAEVPASDGARYLDELLVRARVQDLAEDPAWLRLGRWRKKGGGYVSEVDGLQFFRSLRGKTSPVAELAATLRGFFEPVREPDEHPQCRFPARLQLLTARLGIDPARLPKPSCPKLDQFREQTAARSVTLVFSSYYLNNPVSSFGHTFLRLNKEEEARAGKGFELLDMGIDYAAQPDTNNPVVYALKGLLGAFPGRFSRLAYYYKVRTYADAESRDLWEYDLDLTPEEVRLFVSHLWELGQTYFDYWYLDENCSYHILGALEAAVPRVTLLDRVGAVVIPADTVKALFENPGFVRRVHYRPSIRAQFEGRVAGLDGREQALVERLSEDAAVPFPDDLAPARRAAVLDAAVDLVDLRHFRNLVVDAAPEAARTRHALLVRRAGLGLQSAELVVPTPADRAPEAGHGSWRVGAGGGDSSRLGAFAALDLRVALHDLADPLAGYPLLSGLEFVQTRLRFRLSDGQPFVDEAYALRITSLNDFTRFDMRPSWRLRAGAATVNDKGCDGCLVPVAEAGTGFTETLGPLDLYGGADLSLEARAGLSGIAGKGFRAGIGPGGLARLRVWSLATLLLDARWRWLPDAEPRETFELKGTLRVPLGRTFALSLDARRTPTADEGSLVLHAYY
jgi:hypothetical protein